ncbi:MAG: ISNCY family transposase [Bacillales bacterium]|nr:ISNCY family transposase [Bacillales bacterium]
MKGIILTVNEQFKYDTVKSFVDNNSTNFKNLSLKLKVSLKTAYNLVNKYRNEGKLGFRHKNHDHKPSHTISDDIKKRIIDIYYSLGTDVNFSHFTDILKRDYNISISRSVIHNTLRNAGFYSPKSRRDTIKKRNDLIKEKLLNKAKLSDFEQAIVADHLLDSTEAHPRKERSKYFGELVQMDASVHHWFGDSKYHLHAAIDDATGRILGLFFDKQETLYGYYQITKQILQNYGIPAQILTDNRTIFNYNKNGKSSDERDTFTQYGFMCHRLGIALSTSSIPQVKGRIERLFQTLQSRLPIEMRLKNIDCVDKANEFLLSYINEFNSQFALPYNHTIDAFEKQIDNSEINEALSIVSLRTTDNGGCIKYKNHYYHFINASGNVVVPVPKTQCLVVKKFDGELAAIIDEFCYNLEEFQIHREDSILESPTPKVKKTYKPPLSHPYKLQSYLNYLNKYRKKMQNNYSY